MLRLSGHGRGRTWACALGLLLGPRLAFAAPPDAEPPVEADLEHGEFAPIEIEAPVAPEPPAPEAEPPAPEAEPPAEPEPPATTPVAPEPPATPEAEVAKPDSHAGFRLPNPKIPPTGNTQMWFRSTSFLDYFGNNYDPQTNNDRFYALVNYINFGSDTRLKKTWQISTSARIDTHNVFNTKQQALCDADNDGTVLGDDNEVNNCTFGSDYR